MIRASFRVLTVICINLILTSSITDDVSLFLGRFKNISETDLCEFDVQDVGRAVCIPDRYINKFLRAIQNDNVFSFSNGEKYKHFALGKMS